MVVRRPSFVGTASWSRLRTIWRFPDQGGSDDGLRDGPETRPDGQFRRTKGGERPAQVICRPSEPMLAEIHQPTAPRDPRTLALVQCTTRHFEQVRTNRRTEGGQPLRFYSVFY